MAAGGEPEISLLRAFALNSEVIPVRRWRPLGQRGREGGRAGLAELALDVELDGGGARAQIAHEGSVAYRGSSPDEIALITYAASAGVKLLRRQGKRVELEVNGALEAYGAHALLRLPSAASVLSVLTRCCAVVLETLRFTSDRRRMSTVVQDTSVRAHACAIERGRGPRVPERCRGRAQTNRLWLYTKGADDVVARRMRADQDVVGSLATVEEFAAQGLRCAQCRPRGEALGPTALSVTCAAAQNAVLRLARAGARRL